MNKIGYIIVQVLEEVIRLPNPPKSKLSSILVSSGSFSELAKRLLKFIEKSTHSFSKVKPVVALIAWLLIISCLISKLLFQFLLSLESNEIENSVRFLLSLLLLVS